MIELTLPYPPSFNKMFSLTRTGILKSEQYRDYRDQIHVIVWKRRLSPLEGHLCVAVELHPPDRRIRDIDNPIKPLFDSLMHAGLYADDSQVRQLRIDMHDPDPDNSRVEVRIWARGC